MAENLPQLDLFEMIPADPPIRDYQDCMVYPFLSLQKNRTQPIDFHARSKKSDYFVKVQVLDGFYIASIWDWDFILGLTAHLNDAIERQQPTASEIAFSPHVALKTMRRRTSGREYRNLAQTIFRLHATHVFTNIREFDQPTGSRTGFNWITSYSIPQKYDSNSAITEQNPQGDADPTRPWRVTLQPWLYNALGRRSDILAVHPAYFELTGGIERWLYRLARKAVPDTADIPAITFPLAMLYRHAAVTGSLKKFTAKLRDIEARDSLPEYGISISKVPENTSVTLFRKDAYAPRTRRGVFSSDQAVAAQREITEIRQNRVRSRS